MVHARLWFMPGLPFASIPPPQHQAVPSCEAWATSRSHSLTRWPPLWSPDWMWLRCQERGVMNQWVKRQGRKEPISHFHTRIRPKDERLSRKGTHKSLLSEAWFTMQHEYFRHSLSWRYLHFQIHAPGLRTSVPAVMNLPSDLSYPLSAFLLSLIDLQWKNGITCSGEYVHASPCLYRVFAIKNQDRPLEHLRPKITADHLPSHNFPESRLMIASWVAVWNKKEKLANNLKFITHQSFASIERR